MPGRPGDCVPATSQPGKRDHQVTAREQGAGSSGVQEVPALRQGEPPHLQVHRPQGGQGEDRGQGGHKDTWVVHMCTQVFAEQLKDCLSCSASW